MEPEKPSDETDKQQDYLLKYVDLSVSLGLHKESFNFIRNSIIYGSGQSKFDLSLYNKRKSCTAMDDILEVVKEQEPTPLKGLNHKNSSQTAGSESNRGSMFKSKL